MKKIHSLRQINYYYNKENYNLYYKNPETDKFEVIEGFTPEEINNALLHNIDVIAVKKTEEILFDF